MKIHGIFSENLAQTLDVSAPIAARARFLREMGWVRKQNSYQGFSRYSKKVIRYRYPLLKMKSNSLLVTRYFCLKAKYWKLISRWQNLLINSKYPICLSKYSIRNLKNLWKISSRPKAEILSSFWCIFLSNLGKKNYFSTKSNGKVTAKKSNGNYLFWKVTPLPLPLPEKVTCYK